MSSAGISLGLLAGTDGGRRLSLSEHLTTHGPQPALPDAKQSGAFAARLVSELDAAGLTGRGGGGFPTSKKLAAATSGTRRRRIALVINMMEGEPASKKDGVLAAFTPHLVLDGAEALAAALNAVTLTIAVAKDNEAAAESMTAAIAERPSGAKGRPAIKVVTPPGRYVAGEESALSAWLNGNDARPTWRPEKPAALPVGRREAYVENAETAAAIGLIVRSGGAAFARRGRASIGGSALATLSGSVTNPGVREIAVGTPLGEIVNLAGTSGQITGLLLGGYGGTFVGPEALTAPWSPEGLRPFRATPGAGVIHVITSDHCGVTEIAKIARWMANESAGQCGPCVFGLPALADDLGLVARGENKGRVDLRLAGHLDLIEGRGACAHPDGVVRMVRTGLSVFRLEVAAHLEGRRCSAPGSRTLLSLPDNEGVLAWR
jgi:NADH:ubiquinone oxidoreductase subunit F (NADH-binding)